MIPLVHLAYNLMLVMQSGAKIDVTERSLIVPPIPSVLTLVRPIHRLCRPGGDPSRRSLDGRAGATDVDSLRDDISDCLIVPITISHGGSGLGGLLLADGFRLLVGGLSSRGGVLASGLDSLAGFAEYTAQLRERGCRSSLVFGFAISDLSIGGFLVSSFILLLRTQASKEGCSAFLLERDSISRSGGGLGSRRGRSVCGGGSGGWLISLLLDLVFSFSFSLRFFLFLKQILCLLEKSYQTTL